MEKKVRVTIVTETFVLLACLVGLLIIKLLLTWIKSKWFPAWPDNNVLYIFFLIIIIVRFIITIFKALF